MSLSLASLATARRNVAQRIARLIEVLKRAPRDPGPWESGHLQRTLVALDEPDFPLGEEAMMWAVWTPERRALDTMTKFRTIHEPASTSHLRPNRSLEQYCDALATPLPAYAVKGLCRPSEGLLRAIATFPD